MSGVTDEAPSFSPELFAFLRDLADHNDRDWFAANKDRYVADVQEPALAFIEDVGMRLPEVSRHFVADARTTGGSLFRIYRDVRFAKDKSPYKTQVGIQFRHARSRDVHAPGFYLNLEPGRVFMACGSWRPERDTLHAIRTAIAAKPARWTAIVEEPAFAERFTLGGESLKRPPAGFDREHPLIEELKRKDFIASAELTEDGVTAGDFLDDFLELCGGASEFMRFLCAGARVAY
jgi:uncharacterized protein (TIGR02453 family)